MIQIMERCHITLPVYWDGPVGVQCFHFDNEITIINYNHNKVSGNLVSGDKKRVAITLDSFKMKQVALPALA